jgi:hypothetical protein
MTFFRLPVIVLSVSTLLAIEGWPPPEVEVLVDA